MKTAKRLNRKVAKRRLTKKRLHKGGAPPDDGEFTITCKTEEKDKVYAKIKISDNIITEIPYRELTRGIIKEGYNNVIKEDVNEYLTLLDKKKISANDSKGLFIGRGADNKLKFMLYREPSASSSLKIASLPVILVQTNTKIENVVNVGSIPKNFFINYIGSAEGMVRMPTFCQPIYTDIRKLAPQRANPGNSSIYNAPTVEGITRPGGKLLGNPQSQRYVESSGFRVPMESSIASAISGISSMSVGLSSLGSESSIKPKPETNRRGVHKGVNIEGMYATATPKANRPPASSSTVVNSNTGLYKKPKGTPVNTPPRPTAPKPK